MLVFGPAGEIGTHCLIGLDFAGMALGGRTGFAQLLQASNFALFGLPADLVLPSKFVCHPLHQALLMQPSSFAALSCLRS